MASRTLGNGGCRRNSGLATSFLSGASRKKNAFLKNKAGELLKTKDLAKKQTGNKAETKLAILLKTMKTPRKQSGNKPENKAGQLVENKDPLKNKPKTMNLSPGLLRTGMASLPRWIQTRSS
ncbi:MAG: hypothetical protein P8Z30_07680 [Acidobacteriota bacterium]